MKKHSQIENTYLVCPICNKKFIYNENCKYKLGKDYVCTWKCLLKHIRNQSASSDTVKKRGRPKKNEIVQD